jgi:hypothetical protein
MISVVREQNLFYDNATRGRGRLSNSESPVELYCTQHWLQTTRWESLQRMEESSKIQDGLPRDKMGNETEKSSV